ncbi:MAG: hypothetical protein FJZ12_03775, partial [Candidatus Omnitrophica bacterium]|nr:hypothetical protein [Candidatus Omnitrophota bacterium]
MLYNNGVRTGIGFSINNDHTKAAQEAVNSALASINRERVDLAFIFSTEEFNHNLILETIRDLLGDIPILGLSSPAIILNPGVCKNGIVVLILSLPEDIYFNTSCVKDITPTNCVSCGEKLGNELLYGCKGVRRNLSIVFLNGNIHMAGGIITGMQKKVGSKFPIVGVSAPGPVYSGSSLLNNAACGILFGGKINFGLGVKHGWVPLGKQRTVTLSAGNTVSEIDGKPASCLYEEYFAKNTAGLKKDFRFLATFYPLGINISGKREYVLRSISSIGDSGMLTFNGNIPQGSKVRLMISSKELFLESTKEAAESAKEQLMGRQAELVIVFNALSRAAFIGRHKNMEIDVIKEVFGKDTPIAGAYTMTEHAPLNTADLQEMPFSLN